MRAAEHASHGPFRLFECRYGLAEIIERGVVAAASLAKCSIQAVIDSFDINVCAVGMVPRGSRNVDYVVAPDVEQAIRAKEMRLRPEHNTTPGRVEKYQSRGFTLLE